MPCHKLTVDGGVVDPPGVVVVHARCAAKHTLRLLHRGTELPHLASAPKPQLRQAAPKQRPYNECRLLRARRVRRVWHGYVYTRLPTQMMVSKLSVCPAGQGGQSESPTQHVLYDVFPAATAGAAIAPPAATCAAQHRVNTKAAIRHGAGRAPKIAQPSRRWVPVPMLTPAATHQPAASDTVGVKAMQCSEPMQRDSPGCATSQSEQQLLLCRKRAGIKIWQKS